MNYRKHKKLNILLTGGSGFIARNLIELLNKKYNIFAPTHKELELLNAEAVNAYIQNKKIDIIIHTANKGGGRDTKNMMNVVEYNTRMFFNLARNSRFVKKMIHLGSGAEYGKKRDLKKILHGLMSSAISQINHIQEKMPKAKVPKVIQKDKKLKSETKVTFSKRNEIEEELQQIQAKLQQLNA